MHAFVARARSADLMHGEIGAPKILALYEEVPEIRWSDATTPYLNRNFTLLFMVKSVAETSPAPREVSTLLVSGG